MKMNPVHNQTKIQYIQGMFLYWTFPNALMNWLAWLSKLILFCFFFFFEMQNVPFNEKTTFYCKSGLQVLMLLFKLETDFLEASFFKHMLLLLLSRFSPVWLCATPETATHQAPLSLGFSRQEHWSGLPFPSPIHAHMWSCFSHVWLCATPETATHQAPLSTGFSRQEYSSGLPFPSPIQHIDKYKSQEIFIPEWMLGIWPIYGKTVKNYYQYNHNSVQFICSAVSDSLRPHEMQHTKPPWPSPTPWIYSNSCPSSQWCHPTISSSAFLFSRPQSFPASGAFPMSRFFTSGGQSTGVSASVSVLPVKIHDWFPLRLTGNSLQCKGLSRVFSNTTVQKHQYNIV